MGMPDFEKIVYLVSKDTKRGAEIIAKAFYRILRKNGFSEEQILSIASDILGCLTETMRRYEERRSDKHHVRKDEKAKV